MDQKSDGKMWIYTQAPPELRILRVVGEESDRAALSLPSERLSSQTPFPLNHRQNLID